MAAVFATGMLGLTAAAVYAAISAVATGSQSVTSGSLSLTVSPGTGSAGFSATVSNMAPGDTANTYVDLSNGGSLPARDLTLEVVGSGSTLLTTSTSSGLDVAVTECSVAWTVSSGTCTGTVTPLLVSTAAASLGSPTTVDGGPIAPASVLDLQISLTLPDQAETTVNGVPPSSSIQGLSTVLTYTFDEQQRAPITSNN